MFTKISPAKAICLLFLSVCLISCSPMAKLYFGIKDPKVYESNENRLEYYKPFYEEEKTKVTIYTLKDTTALLTALRSFTFPRIYIQNKTTDSIYKLTCFDDIKYDIEYINNNKLSELYPADTAEVYLLKKFITENTKLNYTANETLPEKEWDIYLVSGTFLGKKIRKRTLPISTINGLNQIKIVDLSINKE